MQNVIWFTIAQVVHDHTTSKRACHRNKQQIGGVRKGAQLGEGERILAVDPLDHDQHQDQQTDADQTNGANLGALSENHRHIQLLQEMRATFVAVARERGLVFVERKTSAVAVRRVVRRERHGWTTSALGIMCRCSYTQMAHLMLYSKI